MRAITQVMNIQCHFLLLLQTRYQKRIKSGAVARLYGDKNIDKHLSLKAIATVTSVSLYANVLRW